MAWLGVVLALLAVSATAHAATGVDIEKLTALPPTSDVVAAYVLPTYANKKFPAGKMVDVVLGLRNEGSETYNVSMIAGSLNSPVEFNLYVQNFSHITYGQELAPGAEVSLEYKFFPDPRLDPRDFIVALTAVYSSPAGAYHAVTFFNETINIVEQKQLIDWELVFLILIFAAIFGVVGYVLYSWVVSMGWIKRQKRGSRSKRAAADAATPMSAEHQQDWVKGTNYDAFVKRKAASVKKSTTS